MLVDAQRSQLQAVPQAFLSLSILCQGKGLGGLYKWQRAQKLCVLPWTTPVCKAGTFCSAEQCWGLLSCVFKGICEVGGALSFPFLLVQLGASALVSSSLGWH